MRLIRRETFWCSCSPWWWNAIIGIKILLVYLGIWILCEIGPTYIKKKYNTKMEDIFEKCIHPQTAACDTQPSIHWMLNVEKARWKVDWYSSMKSITIPPLMFQLNTQPRKFWTIIQAKYTLHSARTIETLNLRPSLWLMIIIMTYG